MSIEEYGLKSEKIGNSLKYEVNSELFPINIKEYVERIQKLSEEKKDIQDCIAIIYLEAESKGFDKKALKDAIKMLKLEAKDRQNHLRLTSLYLDKLMG